MKKIIAAVLAIFAFGSNAQAASAFPSVLASEGLNVREVAAFKIKPNGAMNMLANQAGMAALTPTKVVGSEFGGDYKVVIYTFTPESATDTITFTAASNKFRTIVGAFAFLEDGIDAALTAISCSFSALVVTVKTWEQDGTPATDWTGASARLLLIVR